MNRMIKLGTKLINVTSFKMISTSQKFLFVPIIENPSLIPRSLKTSQKVMFAPIVEHPPRCLKSTQIEMKEPNCTRNQYIDNYTNKREDDSEIIDTLSKIEVHQFKMLEKLDNIDETQKDFKNTQEKILEKLDAINENQKIILELKQKGLADNLDYYFWLNILPSFVCLFFVLAMMNNSDEPSSSK